MFDFRSGSDRIFAGSIFIVQLALKIAGGICFSLSHRGAIDGESTSKKATGAPVLDLTYPDKVNAAPRFIFGTFVKVMKVGNLNTRLAALAWMVEPANRPSVSMPAKIKVSRECFGFMGHYSFTGTRAVRVRKAAKPIARMVNNKARP